MHDLCADAPRWLERPGRGLLLAGSISCCVLLAMHFPLPMWGFYLDTFIWGMCGGISMTMGRSIVQEAAPASHRACHEGCRNQSPIHSATIAC